MSDIFLSYKSEDRAKARIIAEALERNGYSVWWDRVIPPGRTFDEVIEEELDAAKCMVVLWSEESVKSEWVRTEASEGKRRKILIPVLIEDVTPPLAFRLIEAAKLIDWDGTVPNPEFDLLVGSVSRILWGDLGEKERLKKEKEEQERLYREEEERKELEIKEKEAKERLQKQKEEERKEKEKQENLQRQRALEETAKQERERQERLLREEEEKTFINSIGMKFTLIPEGEFVMGSKRPWFLDKLFGKKETLHNVTIHKPFYFCIYPVTQREWMAVMGENPSNFKGDDLPVIGVSWDDVQYFITKLNEKEESDKYRLPSEAEWEYAARAGTTTRYSFGSNKLELDEYAWYYKNSDRKTHSVGQKKSNHWGLYDMHGNVWEWVQDRWHSDYDGAPTDGSAWEYGSGADRVRRGGGWGDPAEECHSAERYRSDLGLRFSDLGFRLLREL